VKLGRGLNVLRKAGGQFYLEVGPGQTLSSLLMQCGGEGSDPVLFSTMRYGYERHDDEFHLMRTVGRLWLNGLDLDWGKFYDDEKRCRTDLPSYPMERRRFWVNPSPGKLGERNMQSPGDAVELQVPIRVDELPPPGGSAAHGAPASELENSILAIWRELFGVQQIGLSDNFFELGGHSLLAGQLLLRVRELVHAEVPLRIVFERPTVADLADAIGKLVRRENPAGRKDDLAMEIN